MSPSLTITYAVWSGQPLREVSGGVEGGGESGKQIGGDIFSATSPN